MLSLAHRGAYEAGILHRDISPGNIVILDKEGVPSKGILIDWDMSKPLASITSRRVTRTVRIAMFDTLASITYILSQGTWQFMSAALVGQLDTSQGLMDDLESTLYVVLWMAIMYSPCRDIGSSLSNFLDYCLDPIVPPQGSHSAKADFLEARNLFSSVHFTGRPGLLHLFNQLADLFAARYTSLKAASPSKTPEQRADRQMAEHFVTITEAEALANPNDPYRSFQLKSNAIYVERQMMARLRTHDYIIELFTETAKKDNFWVTDGPAVKQDIRNPSRDPGFKFTKSGWGTTLFLGELDDLNEIESYDERSSDERSLDEVDEFHVLEGSDFLSDDSDMGTPSGTPAQVTRVIE